MHTKINWYDEILCKTVENTGKYKTGIKCKIKYFEKKITAFVAL